MSYFGVFIGLFIIVIIYYSVSTGNYSSRPGFILTEHFPAGYPHWTSLWAWPSAWYGPYWNTFYRPTFWTTDTDHVWPYWVWKRRLPYLPTARRFPSLRRRARGKWLTDKRIKRDIAADIQHGSPQRSTGR